jgi:adenylosuccinate synthase
MQTNLVVGLGFGDEGKGRVVSALASSTPNSLVVRFNGGHQAGHTVVTEDKRHVFSSFGSGTLHGVPTYWSRFCTFYPWAVRNELIALEKSGVKNPQVYVDALCPVTTNFDSAQNKVLEEKNRHGSCGVGFGTTIARHEAYYKLYFQDLFNDTVLLAKLDNIMHGYYAHNFALNWEEMRDTFLRGVRYIRNCGNVHLVNFQDFKLHHYNNVVFEGAQGILLDQDFGFFPNVTRSNTTSKNAMTLIEEFHLPAPKVYYVTRTYQTRHGNGFMSNEDRPSLVNDENETNVTGPYQGPFRKGTLDLDLISYAIQCDRNFIGNICPRLVITCRDQTGDTFPAIHRKNKMGVDMTVLWEWASKTFTEMWTSDSPKAIPLTKIY